MQACLSGPFSLKRAKVSNALAQIICFHYLAEQKLHPRSSLGGDWRGRRRPATLQSRILQLKLHMHVQKTSPRSCMEEACKPLMLGRGRKRGLRGRFSSMHDLGLIFLHVHVQFQLQYPRLQTTEQAFFNTLFKKFQFFYKNYFC